MAGNQLARWFGVAVVGLNAIDQMFFIPAYPFWSLTIIAVDVVALYGLCVYGYVVMPEHVHIIGGPLRGEDGFPIAIPAVMKALKSASAHLINRALSRSGKLWQRESFDHILRSDEKLEKVREYICMNPVRARLAATPDRYLWLWRSWG